MDENADFLTILTGVKPNDECNVANNNTDSSNDSSSDASSNSSSFTPSFTPMPCAPKSEDAFGIFDIRDGKIFDASTRLRLHALIGTCLMNGIYDSRVSALMHLLQWQESTRFVAIAGTYKTESSANDDNPNPTPQNAGAHIAQNNTDSLRRAIWTQLGACGAYDAIVDSVQLDAISARAKTWKIGGKSGGSVSRKDAAPSHIIILALRENPNPTALNKMCEVFAKSGKPVCISEVVVGAQKICKEITATLAALAVAPSVTHLPQIIRCDDVLPERALIGDETAVETLYTKVYQSLAPYNPDDPTLQTVDAFLRFGGALDQTSHNLNVHPNTIRYRLRKVAQTTGWDATDPREAYVLQTAITIGRIRDSAF